MTGDAEIEAPIALRRQNYSKPQKSSVNQNLEARRWLSARTCEVINLSKECKKLLVNLSLRNLKISKIVVEGDVCLGAEVIDHLEFEVDPELL